jgi:serine phosphatase RsbU (regulator of sigma subunit)
VSDGGPLPEPLIRAGVGRCDAWGSWGGCRVLRTPVAPGGDDTIEMTEPDHARAFEAAPVPLLLLTPDLVVLDANREWRAAAAPTVEQLRACLVRARDGRRPDVVRAQRCDVTLPDGTRAARWWDLRTVPVLDEDGDVVLLVHRAEDVTSERRTADSLTGLATTVSALAGAEDRADLLRQLFRHGRPALGADLLAVALLEPGGTHLAVVDTRSPSEGPPGRVTVSSPAPMAAAAAGRPVLQPGTGGDRPAADPPFPGLRAWAALPLRTGRRPLGSLLVGWATPRDLAGDDVRVLEAFAAQCAQAVARVARIEAERRRGSATRGLAETLQRSLLADPPRRPQFEIAVRYRPAAREAQVGGDWYDAFLSGIGETTLAVGDVSGHDWTAAAVAGQLRSMLRGAVSALPGQDLGRVLAALDRALRDTGAGTLATALVARVEEPAAPAAHAAWTLRWSNAGHPPPLLVQPEGTSSLLDRPVNLLLGVDAAARRQEHTTDLRPGATVLLYTDGLVERRDATLDDGLARLLSAAAQLAARPLDVLCDEVIARLDPEFTDDIALLALRVRDRTG